MIWLVLSWFKKKSMIQFIIVQFITICYVTMLHYYMLQFVQYVAIPCIMICNDTLWYNTLCYVTLHYTMIGCGINQNVVIWFLMLCYIIHICFIEILQATLGYNFRGSDMTFYDMLCHNEIGYKYSGMICDHIIHYITIPYVTSHYNSFNSDIICFVLKGFVTPWFSTLPDIMLHYTGLCYVKLRDHILVYVTIQYIMMISTTLL